VYGRRSSIDVAPVDEMPATLSGYTPGSSQQSTPGGQDPIRTADLHRMIAELFLPDEQQPIVSGANLHDWDVSIFGQTLDTESYPIAGPSNYQEKEAARLVEVNEGMLWGYDDASAVWEQGRNELFLYQEILVQQPDELKAFFPTVEQRYQVSDRCFGLVLDVQANQPVSTLFQRDGDASARRAHPSV
jgi:hypothetical protein